MGVRPVAKTKFLAETVHIGEHARARPRGPAQHTHVKDVLFRAGASRHALILVCVEERGNGITVPRLHHQRICWVFEEAGTTAKAKTLHQRQRVQRQDVGQGAMGPLV